MNRESYQDKILLPISEGSEVGERLLDNELLDFIESEIMKLGSLGHDTIKWQEVEIGAIKILSSYSKDLKVLVILIQCIQQEQSIQSLTLSLQLLVLFMNKYWEQCYPVPGTRGALPRKRFFTQLLQITEQSLKKITLKPSDKEHEKTVFNLIEKLAVEVERYHLSADSLDDLSSSFKRAYSNITDMVESEVSTTITEKQVVKQAPVADINSNNEQTIRQDLLKVSDFLFELNLGIEISLRLRRFAAWFPITTAPDFNANKETELISPSIDLISDYQEKIVNGDISISLWLKLEQSLSKAPFWLDGHYLSYQLANHLNQPRCAKAILEELQKFIEKIPMLLECNFKGGIPFINTQTKKWLTSSSDNKKNQQSGHSWNETFERVKGIAQEEGITVALSIIEDGISQATEPRDLFYWRVLSADLMNNNQLPSLAIQEYSTLSTQIQSLSVSDWEPSLVAMLSSMATSKEV